MPKRYELISPDENEKTGKTFWTKCGVGFEREQGGFTLRFTVFPLNGRVLMVEPRERDQRPPAADTTHDQGGGDDDIPF